jgi:hypothetical protein
VTSEAAVEHDASITGIDEHALRELRAHQARVAGDRTWGNYTPLSTHRRRSRVAGHASGRLFPARGGVSR